MKRAIVLAVTGALMSASGAVLAEELRGVTPVQAVDAHEQAQQQLQRQLEELKDSNPAAYQQLKEWQEQAQEQERVLKELQAGAIGLDAARKRLYPLVKARAEQQGASVDSSIAQMKRVLEDLERLKRHPEEWIQREIDRTLGVPTP